MTPAHILEAATTFVEANAHRVPERDFVVVDRASLRAELGYHAANGTLRLEWGGGGIVGLAVIWQDQISKVLELAGKSEPVFRWQPSDPDGDCLYHALVITTEPGALGRLADYFRARFPRLPELAFRRGQLKRMNWLKRIKTKE